MDKRMNYLRRYETEEAFEAEKASLIDPWVTLTEDDHVVHYKEIVPPKPKVNEPLKFTAVDDYVWIYNTYFN